MRREFKMEAIVHGLVPADPSPPPTGQSAGGFITAGSEVNR